MPRKIEIDRAKNVDAKINSRLSDIDAKIEALKALRRETVKGMDRKEKLLTYINQMGYNRSDVLWCYHQLPYVNSVQTKKMIETINKKKKKAPLVKEANLKIGMRLRKLREEKGLTSVEVADIVGVDPGSITAWERGMWRIKAKYYPMIEKALGQPLSTD